MRNLISALRVLAFCVLAVTLISCINNQSNRAQSPVPVDGLMSEPDVTVNQTPHGKVPSAKALEKEFKAELMNAGRSDRIIDADEIIKLLGIASLRPEGVRIGPMVINDYESLVSYADQIGWKVLSADTEDPLMFKNLNIYLENSKSMFGYVGANGNGDFASPIIALFHSGDKETAYQTFYAGAQNNNSDIVCFKSVTANDFRRTLTGGNFAVVKTSPLHNILAAAIDGLICSSVDSTRIEGVACLITDGILSGSNADIARSPKFTITHLPYLEDCIRESVERAYNLGLHCLVYRLETGFKGTYYDYMNGKHQIECDRPYFMVMIGDEVNLRKIQDNLSKESNFTQCDPKYFATYDVAGLKTVKRGKLIPSPSGNVLSVMNSDTACKLKYDAKHLNDLSPLCFKLVLQLASLPDYYLDDDNVENGLAMSYVDASSGQTVFIPQDDWLQEVSGNDDTGTFTIDIRMPSAVVRQIGNSAIRITVPGHQDNWYETMSSSDDTNMTNGDETTFALSYFMGGIMKGFGYQGADAIPAAVDFNLSLIF